MNSSPSEPAGAKRPTHTRPTRVLITAGPTHEPIDRVRYIGNRSSGRMGIALAQAAALRGWPVTLLLGPVAINPPQHSQIKVERFQTAADLHRLLVAHWPSHDLLLMAAAVADYTIAGIAGQKAQGDAEKIKRRGERLTLELVATPDLLASIAPITRPGQMVIGFALEPAASLKAEARRKLEAKRLNAIVANPLETMDSPDITATLFWRDGRAIAGPPASSKETFAEWLLEQVAPALANSSRTQE